MQLVDTRLDFIENIEEKAIKDMCYIRKQYMNLMEDIEAIAYLKAEKNPEAMRTLAIARTNLEASLMYAIKTLCIAGEIKKK